MAEEETLNRCSRHEHSIILSPEADCNCPHHSHCPVWSLRAIEHLFGSAATQRGEQQVSRVLYLGAFWNAVVAALCFAGWRLMRRQRRVYLAAGACVIVAALFIVMRTWIAALLRGQNPF